MKLKITHPFIPLGLAFTLTFIFCMGYALQTDFLFLISLFAAIFLLLVYTPIIMVKAIKGSLENASQLVINIGGSATYLIAIAFVSKLYMFPGASVAMIVGGFFFYAGFLPIWYAAQYRQLDLFGRVFYFVIATCAGLFLLAWQFKIMHYPGANALFKLVSYLTYSTVVPLGLYVLFFRRGKGYLKITLGFVFGFISAFILSNWLSSNLTRNSIANNDTNHLVFEKNKALYESKNQYLYEAMALNKTSANEEDADRKAISHLRSLSNELVAYMQQLKARLIEKTDELTTPLPLDSVKFEKMLRKTNADVPTMLMGVQDEQITKGPFTANELKEKLEHYIQTVETLLPSASVAAFKQMNPFDFSDVAMQDAQVQPWEVYHFYHESLSTVYQTLTNFQANVRYLEMTALNELFNQANANDKGNMAAQLADLAYKYESEKKEKEIMSLQKDKEMNDMKLQAKDAEISNREKTITYFVFALIAFLVLSVFIIRSNILRKQANRELAQQKKEVEEQKHLVVEKQKEITDSITYAKRLQQAILPPYEFIAAQVPESFVLYKPKDIVAGDFYWAEKVGDKFFIAAADCTGHGVPGALVSVVCSNALNQAVNEFGLTDTGKILDKTRELVVNTFEKSNAEIKDGMDISLLCIDRSLLKVFWSGANNPLWYVAGDTLHEVKADKQPVGKAYEPKPFTTVELAYEAGTVFYLFTDGLADQFGGPKGKKFKYKQFEETLQALSKRPMQEQMAAIDQRFEAWRGSLEQVDDVCVIGLRI